MLLLTFISIHYVIIIIIIWQLYTGYLNYRVYI